MINPDNLSEEAIRLLRKQKEDWPALRKGYESLSYVQTKHLQFEGYSFTVQYNPARITSTAAKTDAASIKERKCFLCSENRPAEQEGIETNNFIILCNPFPVFTEHFTIAAKEHTPQRIKPFFNDLLFFAEKFRNNFAVFYNGPECGASAPDHMHFQSGTLNEFPLINEIDTIINKYGTPLINNEKESKQVEGYSVNDGLRKFIYLRSEDSSLIEKEFTDIYDKIHSDKESVEPKLNIVACYRKMWEVIIFLRKKHRPDQFFIEGEAKLTFSPAAIDISGLCILPLEKDYLKFNKELLADCMKQVFI